jgi:hypothetical protein
MLTSDQINDLHRLYWSEHWPIRKIERHLNMGWKTIRKYLDSAGPEFRWTFLWEHLKEKMF